MIVVADAIVLVGELLRKRGRELLLDPELRLLVAEHQWEETDHERYPGLSILEQQGRLTAEQRVTLQQGVGKLVDARAIEVVPRDTYESLEQVATERVPRD